MTRKGWKGEKQRHGMARKGIKTTCSAQGKKLTIEFKKGKILTEAEVNLIKNRMNRGDMTDYENFSKFVEKYEGVRLTPDQTKKGFDWLMNLYKTPRGVERKNNPFGYREQYVLDNFSHFELKDFYNAGNRYHDFYVPYYEVVSKDGRTFEYAMYGGEIHILG